MLNAAQARSVPDIQHYKAGHLQEEDLAAQSRGALLHMFVACNSCCPEPLAAGQASLKDTKMH
jgi:hypothetical protein